MSGLTRGSIDVRTAGLRVFLTLLGINALLGMAVVLGGDMGDNGWRVLGTSLMLTAGVVLGLACSTGRGNRELGPLWMVGVGTAVVSTALWIVLIWRDDAADGWWQTAGTVQVVAVAIACAGMLGLARLTPALRWVLLAAYGVVGLLALMVTIGIWGGGSDGGLWQIIGVLSIALAALAIAIPVLHRAGIRETRTPGSASASVGFCPHCGAPVSAIVDQPSRCGRCATVFSVRFQLEG